ncbi:DUF6968 family protein [Archangium violaceum]|uniref:DUF6968 domain-containing protein n=1 Tax=Archangium violaceum Cb vi76 TaxID=1406225 RepID=A0A084SQS2_9BACT|nr:hypothetical protein [Archangium violaceum]KFA90807.1 hypothetical protein Q664_26195 [Archangium violaceum Cb vi76]
MATNARRSTTKKKSSTRPRALGTVIAERTLTVGGQKDSSVWIRIGKPRKDRSTNNYFCPYSFEGLDDRKVREAWGMDSIQALQNALQSIRLELTPHADALSWEGGQNGWLGFPKLIPDSFGPTFTLRLEKMVERETDRFARALESTHRRAGQPAHDGRSHRRKR